MLFGSVIDRPKCQYRLPPLGDRRAGVLCEFEERPGLGFGRGECWALNPRMFADTAGGGRMANILTICSRI